MIAWRTASRATFEAEERGLADELAAWPREESAVADALWMADMTTGPRGEAVDCPWARVGRPACRDGLQISRAAMLFGCLSSQISAASESTNARCR